MATQVGDEVDLSETLAKVAELMSEDTRVLQGFEDHFESLKPSLVILQAMSRGVQERLNSNSNDNDTVLLLGKMREVTVSLKNRIEDFIARQEKQLNRSQLKNYVSLLSNGRANKEFVKFLRLLETRVSDLIIQGRGLGLSVPDNPSAELQLWTLEDIVGRDESVKILCHYLLSERDCLSVVSILGVNGVGKTTLASMVYKNPIAASRFPCRAWVNIKEEFNSQDILHNIAKQITLDYNEGDLMQDIRLVLSSSRRYLIVLDGVSTPEVWRMLHEFLPITCPGRVLLTTRLREVALEASSGELIHELQLLKPEESWKLFCAKLRDVPGELIQLGKDIVENCKGLPLTISETVGILSREPKTVERWSWLLQELKLKGSIKHVAADGLPLNLQKCLYYFLLFSEGYEIPVRRLTALWLAEGLVLPEGLNDEIPLEVIAKKYLIDLENRTIIQVVRKKRNGVDIKTCRLHHLIRDTLLPKAQGTRFFHDRSGNMIRIHRFAHHPETGNDSDGNQPSDSLSTCFKNIRSFLSFDPREGREPGEHIRDFLLKGVKKGGFKSLRVMDLEGVFRPILPEQLLKELHQLRFLGLRKTYSEILPASVGCLQKLQNLDLKHTCISNVPSSIWKLNELRHLYLSQNYRTKLPSSFTTSTVFPSNLQTLWGGYVDDQSPVKDGLDKLKNLRKLALTCQMTATNQKAFGEWIVKLPFLESLKLHSIDNVVQPSAIYLEQLSGLAKLNTLYLFGTIVHSSVISTLPQCISEITLSLSKLAEDPMPVLGLLPNLKILALFSESYTGSTMMCPSASFPKLVFLKLWKLNQLTEWNVSEGAMPIVGAVEIRSCRNLRVFPQSMKHLIHFQ